MADAIDPPLRAWIEREVGGKLISADRFTHAGRSRSIWALDVQSAGGVALPLILKREVGGGPFTGTAITLGREAAVLKALEGSGVPVPKVFAVSESGDDVVMERLSGVADFVFADADEERRTMENYVSALARLHALDPASLALPFGLSQSPEAAVAANISEFNDAYLRLCNAHSVIDRAHACLEERAVGAIARLVLTHGDAGPGNFLHEHGAITGLIDWEMTHLGDPHDDLAWIWFRTAVLKQGGDFRVFHRLYHDQGDVVIDPEKLAYYVLLIVYRCTVVCHVRQAHDPTHDDARPRQLRDMLAAALADIESGRRAFIPDFRAH